jgi:hypothetical protein
MTEEYKGKSWWNTFPGILTATAAVITALTGLFATLYQAGLIGNKEKSVIESSREEPKESPKPVTSTQKESNSGASGANSKQTIETKRAVEAPSKSDASQRVKPMSESNVIITALDGSQTTVRAESLSYLLGSIHAFELINGQTVDFDKMKHFEVVQVDEATAPDAKASLAITLLSGKSVTGKVKAGLGYDFAGANELGRFTTSLQRVKRVDFDR